MMKYTCFSIACMMVLFVPVPSHPSPAQGATEKSKQEVLDLENHWLAVEIDPAALESILAPDFLHVVPAGIITKDEQLNFIRKHPSPPEQGAKHFENMHVRVYGNGNVAIVNGMVVATTTAGTQKTLFTDVFVQRDGKWQAVNAQELPVTGS
jgi:hypothetical protein